MKRKQFTFYYSFFDVISCIEDPVERVEAYDVLCRYALLGQKPDFEQLSRDAKMAIKAFMPILDVARKKATGGAKGGSMPKGYGKDDERIEQGYGKDDERIEQGYGKDTGSKNKDKDKIKTEEKIKTKKEDECLAAFDLFWEQYPRKVNKAAACAAFQKVGVSLDVLLPALERQKKCGQWLEDGGRFVPYPATWLNNRLWEDTVAAPDRQLPKGCGPMKGSEYADMAKLMIGSGD